MPLETVSASISRKRKHDSDEDKPASRKETEDSPFKKSQFRHYQSATRKTVFDLDRSSCYDLLVSHGIKPSLCQILLEADVNGKLLKEWAASCKNHSVLQKNLNAKYFKQKDKSPAEKLSENDARHLFALIERYQKNPYRSKSKIICDCVHGQINMHPLLIKIIDTPQFQRLRYVKQLGSLNFIYPCAVHTRFEHCIGTGHIAGMLISHLKETQPSLNINISDELCVKIAGLCHDLGHGPFSHLFEDAMERLKVKSWKHEMASLDMFDKMISEHEDLKREFASFGLFELDLQFIKDLIYNKELKAAKNMEDYEKRLSQLESLKARGLEKSFLFEIVSNYRNGIDVDKFDYFGRDCLQMGFSNNFDFKRYINCTRVIKGGQNNEGLNQICVRDKEISNIYEMYHVREYLTRRAYKHETASSINLMIVEALMKANNYFKFDEVIENRDLAKYQRLNDNIYLQILDSTDESLKEAREILERIGKRELFKYVGSTVISKQLESFNFDSELVQEDFYKYAKEHNEKDVNLDDVIVEIVRFNYGSRRKNPIENVRFYTKYEPNVSFPIQKQQVSEMLLSVFEDTVFRLYSKRNDFDTISSLSRIFFKWCESKKFPEPLHVHHPFF